MGKKSEAIEKLQQMEEQYGHIAQFHSLKAQYYYMNGEYGKALECVNKFDELEKNSPLTYQMRALIFEEKNVKMISRERSIMISKEIAGTKKVIYVDNKTGKIEEVKEINV